MSECLCHIQGETCSHCKSGVDLLLTYQHSFVTHPDLLPGFAKAVEAYKQCDSLSQMEEALDFLLCSINERDASRQDSCPTLQGLEEFSEILSAFNVWDIFVSAMEKFEAALSLHLSQNPTPSEPAREVDLGPDPSAMMPGLDFVLDLFKNSPSPEQFQQGFMDAYKAALTQSSEMILAQLRSQFRIEGDIVIQGDIGICVNPASPLYARRLTKKVKRKVEEPSWCPSKDRASPSVINRAKEVYDYYTEVSSIPLGAARMNVANTLGPFSFQRRTADWMHSCFEGNLDIINNTSERHARFIEEALELSQAGGLSKESAQILLDYVYSRPVGELSQEVGGVGVTLAALCNAHSISMEQSFEAELARISDPATQARIREKQRTKPAHSPLPGSYPERQAAVVAAVPSAPSALSEEEAKAQVKSLFEFFVEDWMNEEDTALFLKTLWAEVGPTLQKSFVESSALGYSVEAIRNEAFIEIKRSYFKCPEVDVLILQTFLRNGFTIKPGERDLKPYVYEAARKLIAAVSGK